MTSMLVVGAGAVGGYYGGRLAQGGAQVSVVCRSDHDTVKAAGMEIKSVHGDFHFAPQAVLRHAREYGAFFDGRFPDYVLVTAKALPEIPVPALIHGAVGPETIIVLLQNGVEIEAAVAERFPGHEIISGLAFICVNRVAPGFIHHQDYGRLVLGHYPAGTSPGARHLVQLFNQCGVPCSESREVVTARWEKLLWNGPFNPLSVLGGRADTAHVRDTPEAWALARAVMEEVRAVAAACGHPIDPGKVDKNMEDTRVMTPYRTSMLLDFEAGRPLEVEAILGNAVRAARREGVAVPRMETLFALLKLVTRS